MKSVNNKFTLQVGMFTYNEHEINIVQSHICMKSVNNKFTLQVRMFMYSVQCSEINILLLLLSQSHIHSEFNSYRDC